MTARTYTLPSTADEREQLVLTLAALTSEFFGYPARSANLAQWRAMPVAELRRVCGNWRGADSEVPAGCRVLDRQAAVEGAGTMNNQIKALALLLYAALLGVVGWVAYLISEATR